MASNDDERDHAEEAFNASLMRDDAGQDWTQEVKDWTDARALDAIAALLSGQEWTPDTTDAIATIVRSTGRLVVEV